MSSVIPGATSSSSVPGGGEPKGESIQSTVDFLAEGSDDTKPPIEDISDESEPTKEKDVASKETDEKEVKKDDKQELASAEEKENEEKEADEKLNGRRADSFKQLKEKFPEVVKANPWIRDLVHREETYTKLFPTVEDAQEAASYIKIMEGFEQTVLAGDPTVLLSTLDKQSKPALRKFATSFIDSLVKVDKDLAGRVVDPYIKRILRTAANHAQSSNNKNLQLSVAHLSNWLYDSATVPADIKQAEDPEEIVAKKQEELYANTFKTWTDGVTQEINSGLLSLIEDSIKDVELPKLTKRAVISEILESIHDKLGDDDSHVALMRSFWSKAKAALPAGKHEEFKSRLKSAFLDRARTLIPALKNKHLQDVLPKHEPRQEPQRRRPATDSTPRKTTSKDESAMSTFEFLSQGADD